MKLISRILASKLVRWGFVVVALCFGVAFIVDRWSEIHRDLSRIGPWASLAALALALAGMIATMLIWRTLLAGMGSPLSLRAASRILFIGQLGKYLPGSVWPVLAQMELATENNVPRARTAAASIINMGVSLLAAILAGLIALPFTGGVGRYWWAFGIAVPLIACLYPPVLNRMLALGFRILRRPALEQPLTGRVIATAMGWSFVSWIFLGLHVWVLMLQTGADPVRALPLAIGAFAFAFAVGFVIILLPAGAGLRDVLIAIFIASMVSKDPAAAIALISRVATTLSDVILAGAAFVSYRRGRKRENYASSLPKATSPTPLPGNDRCSPRNGAVPTRFTVPIRLPPGW